MNQVLYLHYKSIIIIIQIKMYKYTIVVISYHTYGYKKIEIFKLGNSDY